MVASNNSSGDLQMIDTFNNFIRDQTTEDMYITGRAGTGKTTGLAQLVQICIDQEIPYLVCAFTHKACGILAKKLPPQANISTLHKYLKKRPTINTEATHHKHVKTSTKQGESDESIKVLFIDEYSMVGEKDLMDIRGMENPPQVVWLGDLNQLPPVNDQQTVKPRGKYVVTLTKVYRQASDNPLMATLNKLVSFIEGAPVEPLEENSSFIRGQDVIKWYNNDRMASDFDGVLLAFTNSRVQELNALAEGKNDPEPGDRVHSPTTRGIYTYLRKVEPWEIFEINKPYGEPLMRGSKYKTLEYILQQHEFVELEDEDGEVAIWCVKFGHQTFKDAHDTFANAAVDANNKILNETGMKASQWAKQNNNTELAKRRAKAWRDFLSFNECCICIDFAHAMTVHKSQGSTFDNIYLDLQDLNIAADINYRNYLKLMYVAISRAAQTVVTN